MGWKSIVLLIFTFSGGFDSRFGFGPAKVSYSVISSTVSSSLSTFEKFSELSFFAKLTIDKLQTYLARLRLSSSLSFLIESILVQVIIYLHQKSSSELNPACVKQLVIGLWETRAQAFEIKKKWLKTSIAALARFSGQINSASRSAW